MRIQEYLTLLGMRLAAAEDRRDVDECRRLAALGQDVFRDYFIKCETAPDGVSPPGPLHVV